MALAKSQRSLRAWTKQKWGTKSGKKSSETGERYLPKAARDALSPAEYAATSRKKREDTAKGKQHSKQPKKIARKVRKYRRVGKQEGGELNLFGKDGLIFDHTNPLDYLMAVPGLGILGIGAKALSTLAKGNKLKKLPKTQYHGGYSSVDKGMANKTGIYVTPDKNYAYAFSRIRGYKGRGKPGLYKLDLSSAKNIELTDKPSKELLKIIDKELDTLKKKGYKNLTKNEKQLENGLEMLFKIRPDFGVRGGGGQQPKIALDFLRKQGVEILTDSKTLQRGLTGKSTKAEYYLLKDFPKRRLSKDEIETLIFSYRQQFNLGGEVNTELKNFLNLATQLI